MTTNERNPGMPLDLDWVMGAHVNKAVLDGQIQKLYNERRGTQC